jgi:hypothetical protein
MNTACAPLRGASSVPDTGKALSELCHVMPPGGHLLLQVPVLPGRTAPPTEPEFQGKRHSAAAIPTATTTATASAETSPSTPTDWQTTNPARTPRNSPGAGAAPVPPPYRAW